MEKRIISIFTILFLFIISIQSVSALNVYLGLEILTLTDDPANGCINDVGGDFGPQGRIRALSSILPNYPLYFNLSNQSNGAQIWAGDSTKDTDYGPGEIIFLPNPVDLISGETYNLMMDIDAYRIYLPLKSFSTFTETINDEYWTIGKIGTESAGWGDYFQKSNYNNCDIDGIPMLSGYNYIMFVKNSRTGLDSTCMDTSGHYTCSSQGFMGIIYYDDRYDFNLNHKYDNLHLPTVGNFNMQFTMP